MRTGISITVSPSDRQRLEAIVRDRTALQKHVWRARIVPLTGDGLGANAIMRGTGKSKTCVWRWRERFMEEAVDGLSRDPAFAEKVRDVIGLYVAPPDHAIVLSIDEKSQIQALDRTQPGPPMKPGRCATMTHDYKRHGTTPPLAALNVLAGTVIARDKRRHRHGEFIGFLNAVNRAPPAGRDVHAIIDNCATHKHEKVRAWLARHPNWTFHFTPTSSSWLNAVEGFFAKLTRRRLKRGAFHSVADLQGAINRFVAEHNQTPAPFKWKADPDEIIAAAKRGHQTLESIH